MDKFIVLVVAVFIGAGTTTLAKPKEDNEPKKVVICHATSSETNPYNQIEVSENAIGGHFENPGTPLAGHEDDLLLQVGQDCPEGEQPPKEEPKSPPVKVETPVVTETPQTEEVTPENVGVGK